MSRTLVEIERLVVHYPGRELPVRAVDGVSLSLAEGETLALVGESGCGKSTVARALMGLVPPTSGRVRFEGTELAPLGDPARRPYLPRLQMVFQDPDASLNPRLTVGASVSEPLEILEPSIGAAARAARVRALLEDVGLDAELARRYPSELSGGQKQRVCLARALGTRPSVLVCDEAVSALDVSIQAQVLNLLADLRERLGLTLLFITHDLRVVRHLAHRVAVMYLGEIVELGDVDAVFEAPAHPYTQALLAAVPSFGAGPRRSLARARGEIPSPTAPPPGCRFHTRCPSAFDRCRHEAPPFFVAEAGTESRCFLSDPESRS